VLSISFAGQCPRRRKLRVSRAFEWWSVPGSNRGKNQASGLRLDLSGSGKGHVGLPLNLQPFPKENGASRLGSLNDGYPRIRVQDRIDITPLLPKKTRLCGRERLVQCNEQRIDGRRFVPIKQGVANSLIRARPPRPPQPNVAEEVHCLIEGIDDVLVNRPCPVVAPDLLTPYLSQLIDGVEQLDPNVSVSQRGVLSQPKAVWRIPEARHVGGFDARPREYERRVVAFFDRALLTES